MSERLPRRGGQWNRLTPYDRLMTRVNVTPDGHWLWTGSRFGLHREYGQCNLDKQRMGAHRAMWIILRGPIPDGLDLLHQCGQTLCVSPDHLRPGTHRENLAEALAARFGKHWAPKGEACVNAKLTQGQVDEIRKRRSSGTLQRVLAAEYGVSQPEISYITRGIKWKA